ncbi:glucose-6-phosphate dehydrogenase [Companilactobacillus kimchii]|uniref:Glucose-6-phosphate 1-dehydrogenase n=2 Tax=Companilactobacillus kimchii TaxID=2801452 RepID=A0ABR5NTH8_9LACO|nr:glucose-6-phosphate dehydrogenase [Companilactobacillus kimchii]KAE9558551.1 glucose-6-phosphate dehydrogenase [Companilactobacillus kimchii]KRK51671.1 glucose-6-phosphate 1-dehydrogenase [Companilactobacillus kimchii DSM 13961 = JCM 10707]OWF34043.1 Glucose-6-phosphate dehydrogenase (NADP(+)) [Companilactobacillus kimchii]GEO47047.1 glucose-6-phosphate 1-dehydrogenase [Companilactobacillus paralimentarius]
MVTEKSAIFIIFGGSGDLAHRKLYPSLFRLYKSGILKDHFAVIGTARRPWSDDYFRETVITSLKDYFDDSEDIMKGFAKHFFYQSHDVNDSEHYIALKNLAAKLDDQFEAGHNRVYYMAIAPRFFGTVAEHINSEGLKTEDGYNRLVIEKPFGRDLDSACELNGNISKAFPEDDIYRIDHYLGKEMIQDIPHIRANNPKLEAAMNNKYVSNIQITLAESLGVEDRGGYYETAGVLRDMVQNHIMQIIGAVASDDPEATDAKIIHKNKTDLFSSLKELTPEGVDTDFVRGQYDTDKLGDEKAYRQEDNVAEDSNIETFVAGNIQFDTERWSGVPFYVRSGKRMPEKSSRIDIVFNDKVDEVGIKPNTVITLLIERVNGNSILINGINYKESGQDFISFPEEAEFDKAREAYESLIIDILSGNRVHFTLWDELRSTWKYIDTIRNRWDEQTPDFPNYLSGSMGPDAAEMLLERNGNSWVWDD